MGRFEHLELKDSAPEQREGQEGFEVADGGYYLNRARLAFSEDSYERALTYYSRALQYDLNMEEAWTGQVRCLAELRELPEAATWADRALQRFPNAPDVLAARALVCARSGQAETAMGFVDAAFKAKELTPFVWIARGEGLVTVHRGNAAACFSKAVEMAPTDGQVRRWIGRAYFVRGRYVDALAHYEAAAELDPGSCANLYWIGRCREHLGETDQAANAYERALVVRPDFREARKALEDVRRRGLFSRLARILRPRRRR